MLKKYFFGIAILCFSFTATAVFATDYYFYIQLTDKNNSPYCLSNPAEFLSERAIARRNYFRLAVDSTDLPVNPHYLRKIEAKGFRIHNRTRWLNGATVVTSDSASINRLENLDFVKWIEYTGKVNTGNRIENRRKFALYQADDFQQIGVASKYGFADAQLSQVNGKYLHNAGFRGDGIYIGVLDAGFFNADIMPAFESLRSENRLLGTKDFVNPASDIFREHSHGSSVLSVMASHVENQHIGTAPMASYWLVRTENVWLEYLMEMDFWISGLEFLDSVGIDVVNSSLIYRTFDDPRMNFTHADMNGRTTRMSRAAEMASQKGIVVVNSAGNDGNGAWRIIGAPADAKGIITVGAVTSEGVASNFSSFGPSADGRIKPEIAARGSATALMNVNGNVSGNGTSFSAPIIAGMMACLLQFVRENHLFVSLDEILQAVFRSANNHNSPTEQLGFGIPDFGKAANFLLASNETPTDIFIFTDALSRTLQVNLGNRSFENAYIQIFNTTGKILLNQAIVSEQTTINTSGFSPGIYAVRILFSNRETKTQKVVIF